MTSADSAPDTDDRDEGPDATTGGDVADDVERRGLFAPGAFVLGEGA